MLDLEQRLAAVEVGDDLEAILILIALFGHQTAIEQFPVRSGEIADIDLDVVPVIGRYLRLGLAEDQLLSMADRDPRRRRITCLVDARDRTEDLGVEPGDTLGGAGRNAIAPRTGRLDVIVVLGESELRALERLAHIAEPSQQRLAIGHDQADLAAQPLRLACDQVELAAADIHPHVVDAGHQVGVARQPEPADVEQRRLDLVFDLQVDVLQADDVAEILGAAIVLLAHVSLPRRDHRDFGIFRIFCCPASPLPLPRLVRG